MHNTTSRFFGPFTRAGLFVALAASILALTPRTASADALICNEATKGCIHLGASCDFWNPMPSGWICLSLGPIAIGPINRDPSGGASIAIGGKTSTLISPSNASAAKLKNLAERRRDGNIDKQAMEAFPKELDATVRSSNRKVSDEDLKKISKAFNLTIETKLKK